MLLVHSALNTEPKPKQPTKKQLYHQQMVTALRRKQYADHERALTDPDVMAAIEQAQKLQPGWVPKFRK